MLQGLDELAIQYRWSNRFVYLDAIEAEGEISKYRRKWEQKKRGWKDQIMESQKGPVNRDAERMADDTEEQAPKLPAVRLSTDTTSRWWCCLIPMPYG